MSDTAVAEDTAAEEQVQQEQQASEDKARKQGWVPEDEFHGAKEDWKPADEWLAHGETERQKLRREKAELEERFAATEATLKETQTTLKEFKGYHERVEKKAYERALGDLKTQQRKAVEDGDTEAFEKAEKEIDALDKEVKEAAKPKPNGQEPPEHPDFKAWAQENEWFEKNPRMRKYADDIAEYVAATNPQLVGKGRQFFDEITKAVKEEFPAHFENPRRNGPSTVESTGSNAPTPKGKQTYENLPAEAKAACDNFIAEGLIKDRKEYVENYEWE